jgi:hypothetical protein
MGCGVVAAIVGSTACGSSSAASTSSGAKADQKATVSTNRPIANVCDGKIITPEDLATLLPGPTSMATLAGDPQTCEYKTSDFARVSITVRPGLGDVSVSSWTSGRMPVESVAVNGIGDRAVWQSTLRELIATKHNVLCDIGADSVKGSEAEVQKTFGQLCNKIWAAQ